MAITHYRKGKNRPAAVGGSEANLMLAGVPAADDDSDDSDPPEVLGALYRRALELVRAEFEDRTWQMFWQVVVDEKSPADVAAQLHVSTAAVRQAKSRVLRRLKEEVGDVL
jgi:RNA polymerase sigma-70 factor (ECF subfamily)